MLGVLGDLENWISKELKDHQIENDTHHDCRVLDHRALRKKIKQSPVQYKQNNQ
jgi:hypothetical protein